MLNYNKYIVKKKNKKRIFGLKASKVFFFFFKKKYDVLDKNNNINLPFNILGQIYEKEKYSRIKNWRNLLFLNKRIIRYFFGGYTPKQLWHYSRKFKKTHGLNVFGYSIDPFIFKLDYVCQNLLCFGIFFVRKIIKLGYIMVNSRINYNPNLKLRIGDIICVVPEKRVYLKKILFFKIYKSFFFNRVFLQVPSWIEVNYRCLSCIIIPELDNELLCLRIPRQMCLSLLSGLGKKYK